MAMAGVLLGVLIVLFLWGLGKLLYFKALVTAGVFDELFDHACTAIDTEKREGKRQVAQTLRGDSDSESAHTTSTAIGSAACMSSSGVLKTD